MDPEMVARTIQLIIAPTVMITSCCIFAVLVIFMIWVASQLIGVVYAVFDTFMSHKISALETGHVLFLGRSNVEHTKI
jgi:hypothetical protein